MTLASMSFTGTSFVRAVAGAVALLNLCGCSLHGAKSVIHVGSKNFTEQVVLGEIIAQHLEHRLHQQR